MISWLWGGGELSNKSTIIENTHNKICAESNSKNALTKSLRESLESDSFSISKDLNLKKSKNLLEGINDFASYGNKLNVAFWKFWEPIYENFAYDGDASKPFVLFYKNLNRACIDAKELDIDFSYWFKEMKNLFSTNLPIYKDKPTVAQEYLKKIDIFEKQFLANSRSKDKEDEPSKVDNAATTNQINSYIIIYSMNHYTKVNAKDEEEAKQLLLSKKKNAKISRIMPASEFKRGTQNMNENLIYESIDDTINVDKAINFFKLLTIEKFAKIEPGTQTFDDIKFTIEPSGNDLIKWSVDIPKDKKYNHFSFALDLNKGSQIRQIFKDDVLDVIDALEDIKTQSTVNLKESKISIEDWDQDLILKRAFEIFRGDDDTVFNSEAMEKVGLLIDSQTIKLPKGTILEYESIGGYNTPAAIYSLPQYNNVKIKIYWDVWEEDLSKVVKAHLKESVTNYDIAFIDVSGSNSGPKMIKVSEKLAKDAGAQKLMYFAGKIGKTPEEAFSNGTYYEPIQKYLNDNNISKAIVVTDEDVEMNEDGKDLQKDSRVTIIRNDKYRYDPEAFLNGTFNNVKKSIPYVIDKTSKTDKMTNREKLQRVFSKGLKESYNEAQYEYLIFVNNEVLDDYFEDEDSAYAKAEELKQSKYYNDEKIYKIELWRAPLGELDGELYDTILDESYNNVKLNQLKESLGTAKYNKIQSLIKECLKEGMEVEITIPKKKLLKEAFSPRYNVNNFFDELGIPRTYLSVKKGPYLTTLATIHPDEYRITISKNIVEKYLDEDVINSLERGTHPLLKKYNVVSFGADWTPYSMRAYNYPLVYEAVIKVYNDEIKLQESINGIPTKGVIEAIKDVLLSQGGTEEEARIIAYALAQSSYEHGNGRKYTIDLYENDIKDEDDFLLNIEYYLKKNPEALELFKIYYL